MDRARFAELCDRFPRNRIVVLGDLMLDRYVAGPADRVSPEAPVPVVRVEEEWDAVGGAGNVAANPGPGARAPTYWRVERAEAVGGRRRSGGDGCPPSGFGTRKPTHQDGGTWAQMVRVTATD